jgi:L-ascorbate metabolism protein UlaG (beta-lactamase superfamily)
VQSEFTLFIFNMGPIWSYLLVGFTIAVGLLLVGLFIADHLLAAPHFKTGKSNHFDGKKFVNLHDGHSHHYGDVLKWWLGGNDKGPWKRLSDRDVSYSEPPQLGPDSDRIAITFINHASFLIQFDGHNILTDPIWSDRASPYSWIGPKRMRPPGVKFEDLPPIDTVLLSHNHYDHLDEATVLKLWERYRPLFITPLGVSQFLHSLGITKTMDLDWWDNHAISEKLNIHAVPAQHFSGRGLFDRNKTLWCGYVFETDLLHGNIYYAGDTGYGPFFKDIYDRFAPIEASMIPIGAFKPEWFMESIHVSPDQAVRIHQDVQSKTSIAMHYGTFPLADDGMFEAVDALKQARDEAGLTSDDFMILPEGDTHYLELKKRAEISY